MRCSRPRPDPFVHASDTRCRAAALDPRTVLLRRQNGFPTTLVIPSWCCRSRCLPLRKARRGSAPKGAVVAAATFAGRRRQPVTRCCPRFEKRRLDSLPHRFGRWFDGRASLFQLLQPGFFHEHDHGPLELRPGFPGMKIRPRSKLRGAIAEHVQGQGPGFDRCPAPPPAIARRKSFAPTSSVSSISCRERRAGLSAWRDRPFGVGRHHGHRLRNGGR